MFLPRIKCEGLGLKAKKGINKLIIKKQVNCSNQEKDMAQIHALIESGKQRHLLS
jgi:hypothetical protein